jgi:hypothetical protein
MAECIEMNWLIWALLSAFFAGLTAILAKIGVQNINSNLATAIRTVVILIFVWTVEVASNQEKISSIGTVLGFSWCCPEWPLAYPGCVISAPYNSAKLRKWRPWTS